jgi:hypothetical protein
MNQEQVKSVLQVLLASGGPVAALLLSYGVPADKMNLWFNLAIAVVPPLAAAAWGIWERTHKRTIAAAAAVPGVAVVTVDRNAADGAAAAAADPKLTNVQKEP